MMAEILHDWLLIGLVIFVSGLAMGAGRTNSLGLNVLILTFMLLFWPFTLGYSLLNLKKKGK